MPVTTARIPRSAGVAALLAGVAFAAGVLLPTLPGGDNGVARTLQAYRDTGPRTSALVAALLLLSAALLLAWLLATLLVAVRSAGTVAAFAGLTGAAAVGALLVGAAALTSLAVPLMTDPSLLPDTMTTTLGELAVSALVVTGLTAGATMVALSVAARRTGVLPRWVARAGLAIGPLMLLSVTVAPVVLLSVWLVLLGAAMALRPDGAVPAG